MRGERFPGVSKIFSVSLCAFLLFLCDGRTTSLLGTMKGKYLEYKIAVLVKRIRRAIEIL